MAAGGAAQSAGGRGERVVHEPRVPQGPTRGVSESERRERWGGCGEGTAQGVGAPDGEAALTGPAGW